MLPGFIIDQIRQREEEEQRRGEQPQIQLPIHSPEGARPHEIEDEPNRGVVIIDLMGR